MTRRLALLFVVGAVAFGIGARQAEKARRLPKSSAVKRAVAKRDRAVEQAESAYLRAAGEANKALLVELKKAKAAALKAADLDEANAVAALIGETEKGGEQPRGESSSVAGAWVIAWSRSGLLTFEFSGDETQLRDPHFRSVRSERAGDTRVYWLDAVGRHDVHRYRRVGAYIVGEVWEEAAAFARGDRPYEVGIGQRPE